MESKYFELQKETKVTHIGNWLKTFRFTTLFPAHAILLLTSFTFYACGSNTINSTETGQLKGTDRFDSIVQQVFKNAGLMDSTKFSFNLVTGDGERHYVVKYLTPAKDDLTHWIVAVSVAEAGKYIDPIEYDAILKTLPEGNKPVLGKRYMDVDLINKATDFAPPGMFSGNAFTTNDEKYDIRILLSDMLPKDATPPKFNHDAVGSEILEMYNKD